MAGPGQGRLKDIGKCPSDSHGCPGCAHSVQGPATGGSPDVVVNGQPALRVGDPGVHSGCCGANTWVAAKGSGTVLINGKPSHRKGDMQNHCGGVGQLDTASSDVLVG